MGAMFSALLRGLVGVVAAVVIVAVTWTVYLKRDAVTEAGEPVVRMLTE